MIGGEGAYHPPMGKALPTKKDSLVLQRKVADFSLSEQAN